MRVLAERPRLTATERALVVEGLQARDPFVQRAAADALGRHPSTEALRPLLDLLHPVPAEDTHLRYVVRMALRNNLRPAAAWKQLPLPRWTPADAEAIADVALGVPSAEAADFVMEHLRVACGVWGLSGMWLDMEATRRASDWYHCSAAWIRPILIYNTRSFVPSWKGPRNEAAP
jgi:hypothetical protein